MTTKIIHSLEMQLRDCRELLNQTNQELAAVGNERDRLAESNDEMAIVIAQLLQSIEDLEFEASTTVDTSRALHALNQHQANKARGTSK